MIEDQQDMTQMLLLKMQHTFIDININIHVCIVALHIKLMSTHPLAPEELQGGVDVAEVVWPPQHSASLHRQPLSTEDLE